MRAMMPGESGKCNGFPDFGRSSPIGRLRAATSLAVPATRVPVATCRRVVARDHDLVAVAGRDLVVATGAAVWLQRLVRVDVPDLELVERAGGLAHHREITASAEEGPDHQRRDHHERHDHNDDVGATVDAAPERVEPHWLTVPA